MLKWIRANIIGGPENGYRRPDPDFGTALPGDPAAPASPTPAGPAEEEERLVVTAERLDQIKEGLEAALHGPEPLHLDVVGPSVGFVRGVAIRVLAHVLAVSERNGEK